MGIPAESPVIRPRNRPGVALAAVIFGMVVVSLITVCAWTATEFDARVTNSRLEAATALRLAHTAETHALSLLRRRLATEPFNRLLSGSDNVVNTADDGLFIGYTLGDSLSIPATGRVLEGVGTYYVTIKDDPSETDGLPFVDSNRRLLITCRGVSFSGSSAEVNVIVSNFALPGIAVEGNLEISAKPTLTGACGGIHANGNITGGGVATVTTNVSATGTVNTSLTVNGGPRLNYQPPLDIPDLIPLNFCGPAAYKYIGSGSPNFSSGTWKPKAADITGGVYCVSGNVEFQEDVGSAASPKTASIIAYGSIKVGGKKVWLKSAHPDDIVLLSGGDLDLQGEAGFTGVVYGRAQCYVSDKMTINGQFICRNKTPQPAGTADYLQNTSVIISGDATVNFTCNNNLFAVFGVVAWYPTIGS